MIIPLLFIGMVLKMVSNNKILAVASFFNYEGKIKNIKEYGNGHINKTFLIETTKKKYIFQVINSYAFGDIEMLMNNIALVTEHLVAQKATTLEVIKTFLGETYYTDKIYFYRMYSFVDNTVCYEEITDLSLVEKTGAAFGLLHKQLEGLDPKKIFEIIKDFHNTPVRYKNLIKASKKDNFHRLQDCQNEFDYIKEQKNNLSLIVDGIKDGSIPMRITHNDPKINNVLFDKKTGAVKCVIDLDTIMPGSALYDFGDALRSLFTGDNEDNEDLSKLKVNFDIYKAFTKGFLSQTYDAMTPREVELLPMSVYIIAIELASRFLEDHLRGDAYFHVSKKNHNLLRARTQIALAQDVMKNMDELNNITKEIYNQFK